MQAAARIRREGGRPTAESRNLADPECADGLIRSESVDLSTLGQSNIADPHRPLYAAMALGENATHEVLPIQYSHALERTRDEVDCGGFGPIERRN